MIPSAGILILLGIVSLLLAIVSLIFAVIGFANNKSNKYGWLAGFLIALVALIFCIVLVVRKAVNKVSSIGSSAFEQFEDFNGDIQEYDDSLKQSRNEIVKTNEQIKLLKTYYPDSASVNDDFYSYLGFQTYLRLPIRYPYSIHCLNVYDNGELFNEKNVTRFDENDNGEIDLNTVSISKLSFDQNYLLLEQNITSTRSEKVVQHFILFSFETEKKEEASSLNDLLKLAKSKGYKGSEKLMTLEEYSRLF